MRKGIGGINFGTASTGSLTIDASDPYFTLENESHYPPPLPWLFTSALLSTSKDSGCITDIGREGSGGGELLIHCSDGRIGQENTIPPGNGPFPPEG